MTYFEGSYYFAYDYHDGWMIVRCEGDGMWSMCGIEYYFKNEDFTSIFNMPIKMPDNDSSGID
jgi:hypothetical protein